MRHECTYRLRVTTTDHLLGALLSHSRCLTYELARLAVFVSDNRGKSARFFTSIDVSGAAQHATANPRKKKPWLRACIAVLSRVDCTHQ